MKNPYEVLGVSNSAGDDEIREAYKKLVRKYHPDQYLNNPLSDLAEEKLKEINDAYDTLMKNSGKRRPVNNSYNDFRNDSSFVYIRETISKGDLNRAERLLENIKSRNGEWYFLKGVIFLRKGWSDEGYRYISKAVKLEPNNSEYRNVLDNISFKNSGYREYGNNRGYRRDPSFCEICQCLICTDCCCECMGGDLINC